MNATISVFEAREILAALAYARWPYYQGGKLDASHVVPWAEIQADWQRGPCYAWAEKMLVALANAGVEPFASLNREPRPTSEPEVGGSPPAMLGDDALRITSERAAEIMRLEAEYQRGYADGLKVAESRIAKLLHEIDTDVKWGWEEISIARVRAILRDAGADE